MGQELESSAIPANEPNAGTNIGHWLLSPSADTTDNHGRPFTRNAGVLDLSALQPSDTSSDTLDPVVGGTASSVSHKNSNGINSSQGDNNPAVGITSRPDVVAGVIILSLGILVLLVAITFYLINGRSWKSPRRQRCKQGDQDNHDQVDSIEAGLKEKSAHSRDEGDDEALETSSRPGPSKRSSTSSQQPCDTAVAAETVMSVSNERRSVDNGEDSHGDNDSKSNDDDDDDDSEDLNPPEGQGHKTYDMPQPEHSPTTARLENPPVNKSVFAFLKGTTQSHNHHGHRDPFYATDLPALTRIKARSSIEQKTNRLLLPHGTRCPTPNVGSKARSHLSVSINLRDPHLDSSSSASSMSATTAMETATGSSRGPLSSSPLSCSSDASLPPHPPALLARNSVLHGKAASRSSCTQSPSIAPILSRLDINAPCSSSVMGLYPGSARSSPNGSLADAASVRAVYCHSLKSTMSYTTQAESTLGLVENHEIEPR